jgi:cytochrome c553
MRVAALILACLPLHALADARAGEEKAQLCLFCHKEGAELRFTPLLERQPANYLVATIMAFKTGERKASGSGMNTNVANLSQADIRDISDYFASKPLPPRNQTLDPAKIAAGEKIVGEMKCAACHMSTFHGAGAVPRLAAQKQPYLVWQLEAFRGGRRSHPLGTSILKDGADVESAASYFASLP